MHNLKPKKYWGQHFLTDPIIAARITALLQAKHSDVVVEIGPGQGILTKILMKKYPALKVIEIDPEAIQYLQTNLELRPDQIIATDVLKWKPQGDIKEDSFFIGNLPYNISSPFFFMMMENLPYVKEGVFMIQKEVAERICARPGNKTYGILSVLLGAYFDLEYAFSVPPHVFRPPPKVMSGVLRIRRKKAMPDVHFPLFKRLVKQAFNQRRKTLRNALKGIEISHFEGKDAMFQLRAEALDTDTFLYLTSKINV